MKHLKRIPATAFLAVLAIAGLAAILAGVYLLLGLAPTLITGGVCAVAVGLLVDA